MEKDKRYLLFQVFEFDSYGGLNDMKSSFDTLEDADVYIKDNDIEYYDVYDRVKGMLVKSWK